MIKILAVTLFVVGYAFAQAPDWQSVQDVFGKKGAVQGGVLKITFPRSDLNVKVGEVSVDPALALTSWIAFDKTRIGTMMMGDIVLLESEVGPVVSKLVNNSIEVTAIHNHIINETPKVMYLHFEGNGNAVELAKKMKVVLSVTSTPLSASQTSPESENVDWSKVESIMGMKGQQKGKMLQFGVPRSEKITENGMEIPPFMGMATGINFQAVGEKAVTTGDFVLLASEVNPVVKALTEGGITVTAIHTHMLYESPHIFFLHFWGFDNPEKLANTLRAALRQTDSKMNK